MKDVSIVPVQRTKAGKVKQGELKKLAKLDLRMFNMEDAFGVDDWRECDDGAIFWVLFRGRRIGSIAFGLNVEVGDSFKEEETPSPGSLYLVSTALIPRYQGRGIGTFLKSWEIQWARKHGFDRICTNCRASNAGSLRLNKKFGFRVTGRKPRYYKKPVEDAIVLKLRLTPKKRRPA